MSNHIKSPYVNQAQAASDTELHKLRQRPLNDSSGNIAEETAWQKRQDDKEPVVTSRGIILPNVGLMKQNVSEKVAQVSMFGVFFKCIFLVCF